MGKKKLAAKAGTKIAAKAGGKLLPGVGQAMMVVDALPAGEEAVAEWSKVVESGARETGEHLKHGRLIKAAGSAFRGSVASTRASVRGAAKAAKAAILNPGPAQNYQVILATLRSLQWIAWSAHWTAAGPNYYGDHQLLQRLYEGKGGGPDIQAEIDGLGEKMVAYFGPQSVAPSAIEELVHGTVKSAAGAGLGQFEALLTLERHLQELIKKAWRANQEAGESFSLGFDDYLMGLANERETAIYLLGRRLG